MWEIIYSDLIQKFPENQFRAHFWIQVLGNKPGLSVSIESIKETGDNTCDVIVTVTENVNGATRKIPSQDLSTFFTGQAMQLKNFGVTNVYAKVGLLFKLSVVRK